jgi:hypothetical protein
METGSRMETGMTAARRKGSAGRYTPPAPGPLLGSRAGGPLRIDSLQCGDRAGMFDEAPGAGVRRDPQCGPGAGMVAAQKSHSPM